LIKSSRHGIRDRTNVVPGFMPGIHVFKTNSDEDADDRDKPGRDDRPDNPCLEGSTCPAA
jgi:hypothetical protein